MGFTSWDNRGTRLFVRSIRMDGVHLRLLREGIGYIPSREKACVPIKNPETRSSLSGSISAIVFRRTFNRGSLSSQRSQKHRVVAVKKNFRNRFGMFGLRCTTVSFVFQLYRQIVARLVEFNIFRVLNETWSSRDYPCTQEVRRHQN